MKKLCSLLFLIVTCLGFGIISYAADAYEPNNSFATAKSISNNSSISATISSSSDEDYYKFKLTAVPSSTCGISLTSPSGKDYDLYLYDENGNQCYSSTKGVGEIDTIQYLSLYGTFYIKVISADGLYSNSNYLLTVSSSSWSSAVSVGSNSVTTSTLYPFGNVDYYKFNLTKSSSSACTITLTPPADKNYDIYLYDSNGAETGGWINLSVSGGDGEPETIEYSSLAPGTYYVEVMSYDGSYSPSRYTLRVTSSPN